MAIACDDWSLTECWRILCRRKATVLWITVLAVLGAALISVGKPRSYQSRASLEIQVFNENFLNLRDVYPTAAYSTDLALYLQTQADLLQQDSLIEAVAQKLQLEPGKVRRSTRIIPARNSRIIQLVCDAREATRAAEMANTMANMFIEGNIEARQRAARQTYESLRVQLEGIRQGLLRETPAGPGRAGEPLTGEADANHRFYAAMLAKANDARIASVVRQSNIRLIAPAEPASRPYKPNLPLNLAIGAVGGLVVGIGYVMLREQSLSMLRAPGEAGAYLALPELGAIPNDGGKRVERAVLEQGSSCLSESFRSTLASILSASRDGDGGRALVVTSSRPMEGKTTVVSNLGIALAEIGSKVLLIDGDMRRPQLHKVFDQANGWGLSDVLRERDEMDGLPLEALVKRTAVPRLHLLPGGAYTDNIFGILHSGRMSRLLARFREEFEYVLMDAPSCLEFADARNLARHADGLVLVVRANHTDRRTAQAAVQRLECDGISMMGVILNRWDAPRSDINGWSAFGGFSRQEIS